MNGSRRDPLERLVTAAVALLAVAFLVRFSVNIITPALPVLGGVTLAVLALIVVRALLRRRDGTW